MEIPVYPDSRAVLLEDKPILDLEFDRLQPRISELAFANIFLFRHAHAYRIARQGDSFVILGAGYDGRNYFLPPLGGNVSSAMETLMGDGLVLYGADRIFLDRYLSGWEHLEVIEDRDAYDYLYLRNDLAELPGNRYHKKKNRISYFASRHAYEIEPYSSRYLDTSLDLVRVWKTVHAGADSPSLQLEAEATAEGLKTAAGLGLDGVVVLVGGDVKAFALGERLNSITSVCHFEKGDPFLEGISQLADREFNRRCFTDCVYVNREQDLGEPNLRRAKMSYHPVELVEKYRVRLPLQRKSLPVT